jgi:Domain of unknown function (DUF5916)
MKAIFSIILCFFLFEKTLHAQDKYAKEPFTIKFINEKVKIDGILDEKIWQGAPSTGDFWQYFPTDTLKAKHSTELYFAYDDKNLYVAAKSFTIGKKYVVTSNRRDYRAGANDNITLIFDTFNDKTNAFMFGMNPLGVMREALIYGGGAERDFFNTFWDNKWEGASKIYDDYWVCEMAIPFTTLRFKEGATQWNLMSYRFDTQTNETTSYVRTPQNQLIFNLAFTAPMQFEKPLKKTGANISLIPYVAARSLRDFEKKNPSTGEKIAIGGDAKIGITSGLNLDLTLNPDFSNVEADQQITNLTRFDISYPEQRQFFIENADLFTGYGNLSINPFFSRRIGIAVDTTTGISIQTPLLYGARISGKLDDNWRIGLLNTQTGKDILRGVPGENFTVAAIQRKVFSRSRIAAIFIDKENLNPELNQKLDKFNRVGGLEYNLASKDNSWEGKTFIHQAFKPTESTDPFAHGTILNYRKAKYQFSYAHDWVGKGYDAQVGFVPRTNYFRVSPTARLNFYPKTKHLNWYSLGMKYEQFSAPKLGVTDRLTSVFFEGHLQNSARLDFYLNNNYTYLFDNFDALRSNGKKPSLLRGADFKYTNLNVFYASDMRKKLSIMGQSTVGQYYDGSVVSVVGGLTYRYQPLGAVTMNVSYNRLNLSTGKNTLYLIGPRIDMTFTKELFWTTFVQYNSQFDNLNVNSRFQWRFAPVSDFFLVYTDNYNTLLGGSKNRAIFAKLIYWFNI